MGEIWEANFSRSVGWSRNLQINAKFTDVWRPIFCLK